MRLLGRSNIVFFLNLGQNMLQELISALYTAHNNLVQPKDCVKVVEPRENNLEVLNGCSRAPSKKAKPLWRYLRFV